MHSLAGFIGAFGAQALPFAPNQQGRFIHTQHATTVTKATIPSYRSKLWLMSSIQESDSHDTEPSFSTLRVPSSLIPPKELNKSAAVYLVGTGPGDPELLTIKALRLLQQADVILYDRLVSPEILSMASTNAVMVYVGKAKGFHTRTQTEIHHLLRQYASEPSHKVIVRLKGGDPYVFGRGGEEAAYLRSCGIRVYAVPGITSAAGIGADLGIPLTHRGIANGCRFVTGHLKDGMEQAVIGLDSANPKETLVVYMGLGAAKELAEKLVEYGLRSDTPVAAVERGTTSEQRIVFCALDKLEERVQKAKLESPTLIIIGDVVTLSPGWKLRDMDWVERSDLEDQWSDEVEHLKSLEFNNGNVQLAPILTDDTGKVFA